MGGVDDVRCMWTAHPSINAQIPGAYLLLPAVLLYLAYMIVSHHGRGFVDIRTHRYTHDCAMTGTVHACAMTGTVHACAMTGTVYRTRMCYDWYIGLGAIHLLPVQYGGTHGTKKSGDLKTAICWCLQVISGHRRTIFCDFLILHFCTERQPEIAVRIASQAQKVHQSLDFPGLRPLQPLKHRTKKN